MWYNVLELKLSLIHTFTNPKDGTEIQSNLSEREVMEILKEIGNTFSLSLAAAFCNPSRLTQSQEFWGHKLAMDKQNKDKAPAPQGEVFSEFSRVMEMFKVAKQGGLQYPKIRIAAGNERGVLSLAPENGRNPNYIYFKDQNKTYLGKISPNGVFQKSGNCTVQMEEILKQLSKNPERITSDYGRATGCCSFCGRELTADDSLDVGRGPICSLKHGLPYGEERKELKEMKQEVREMSKVEIDFF